MPVVGDGASLEESNDSSSKIGEPPPISEVTSRDVTSGDREVSDVDEGDADEDLFANGFAKSSDVDEEEKDVEDLKFDSFDASEGEDVSTSAIKENGGDEGDLDEDFDDFQGFERAPVMKTELEPPEDVCLPVGENDRNGVEDGTIGGDDDFDDDFDDFQAFETAPVDETEMFDGSLANPSGSAVGASANELREEDDDFCDFEAAGDGGNVPLDPAATVTPLWERLCPLPPSEPVEESSARKLEGASVIDDDFSAALWDPDLSSGFKFSWPKSLAWQKFLDSLKMDARNAVSMKPKPFNPNLPVFAASLGSNILQPMPVKASAKQAPGKKKEEVEVMNEPEFQEVPSGANQQVAPPAEFDWAGSGLVNPLTEGESPSLPPDALREFEASTSSTLPIAVQGPSFSNGSAASSAKPAPAPAFRDRSKEVDSLILRVPDLSFMRSKILIFPATGGLN